MASGGTLSITADSPGGTFQTILSLITNCTFFIDNQGAVGQAFINISGLHDADDEVPLPVGITYFRAGWNGAVVQVKGDGAHAFDIGYGIMAK